MGRGLIPQPFEFPKGIHIRKHGPGGWADYRRYRPWLRDEFSFRCVYCLNRERWMDTRRGYQIDHFTPQKHNPDLRAEYSNLLYLCSACNSFKSTHLLPDPCTVALSDCLRFFNDGTVHAIEPRKEDGQRLIDILELDQPQLIEYRRIRIGTIASHALYNYELYQHEMGYPTDLPNLIAEKPPKNSRPEGVDQCCFSRFLAGELDCVY